MTLSQSESHDSWLSCRKRFVTPGKKTEMLLEKPGIQGLKVVSWPDLLEINVAGPWLDLGLFEGQVKVQQHLFLKDLMSVDLCSRHGSVESGLLMTHCVSTQLLTACHLITVVCKVSSAWCLYISSLIILVELLCLCVCACVPSFTSLSVDCGSNTSARNHWRLGLSPFHSVNWVPIHRGSVHVCECVHMLCTHSVAADMCLRAWEPVWLTVVGTKTALWSSTAGRVGRCDARTEILSSIFKSHCSGSCDELHPQKGGVVLGGAVCSSFILHFGTGWMSVGLFIF